MGKYGNISFGKACMQEKELIRHALEGKMESGMDENYQPTYSDASKEECNRAVLAAYDEVVFQAQKALASGRALERLFEEVTGESTGKYLSKYIQIMQEEEAKNTDYIYENDIQE